MTDLGDLLGALIPTALTIGIGALVRYKNPLPDIILRAINKMMASRRVDKLPDGNGNGNGHRQFHDLSNLMMGELAKRIDGIEAQRKQDLIGISNSIEGDRIYSGRLKRAIDDRFEKVEREQTAFMEQINRRLNLVDEKLTQHGEQLGELVAHARHGNGHTD